MNSQARDTFSTSCFAFAHRAGEFGYPVISSIRQALPLCSEFVVGITAVSDPINKVLRKWAQAEQRVTVVSLPLGDPPEGNDAVSWWKEAYDLTLSHCTGEWIIRMDLDEFFHESDYKRIASAPMIAEMRNMHVIRTGFTELTADWRFAVEPSPFDQNRIWRRGYAETGWDGSQVFPISGQILDLSSVRCMHLDLLLSPSLRKRKVRVGHTVHFPTIPLEERDYVYKHQPVVEHDPSFLWSRGWRAPDELVYMGPVERYPRALRERRSWLVKHTHPAIDSFLDDLGRDPEPGERFPISVISSYQ